MFEHKAPVRAQGGGAATASTCCRSGRPDRAAQGDDVTLVGLSLTVGMCLAAADRLAAAGIYAEVIDLRTLVPLDAATVLASVRRTGRLVMVEENPGQLGLGRGDRGDRRRGGVRATSTAPVTRVSGGNMPLPVAAPLEAEVDVSVPGRGRGARLLDRGVMRASLSRHSVPVQQKG